jgi:hypothetical protein
MTLFAADTGLRPFSPTGFEILDEDFTRTGAVVIWGKAARPPRLGDRFNIETGGAVHELAVEEIRSFAGGGWSVTCRAGD